jgi:ribosomal protein L11 methyltransferase
MPAAADAAEFVLNELDTLGTEINFQTKNSDFIAVTGYFAEKPELEAIRSDVLNALAGFELDPDEFIDICERLIENSDWLAEWKRHWRPSTIGRFVIAPPWERIEEGDNIIIRIEPNMAFGTGTHETTQLCLRAIDRNYIRGDSFLDVGTGTGILAIAAAKLAESEPVAKILACDTDRDAIKIARENAVANAVGDRIEFSDRTVGTATPVFDFVCANLTLDVILAILPNLLAKTRRILVLSGILATQREEAEKQLARRSILNHSIEIAGEWISVTISI